MSMINEFDLQTQEDVNALERHIDNLCLLLYNGSEKQFVPQFPLVFVRVLQKEQVHNGIILQGVDQNKPLYEGVVMVTWEPKTFERGKIGADGVRYTRTVVHRSAYKPGDHVVFPHWAGAPVPGWSPDKYRVIKETEWDFSKDGGIYGIMNHNVPDETPRGLLQQILDKHLHHPQQASAILNEIFDRLVLIDRDKPSLTLSGR